MVIGLMKSKGYPSNVGRAEAFILDKNTVIHFRSKDIDQMGIKSTD